MPKDVRARSLAESFEDWDFGPTPREDPCREGNWGRGQIPSTTTTAVCMHVSANGGREHQELRGATGPITNKSAAKPWRGPMFRSLSPRCGRHSKHLSVSRKSNIKRSINRSLILNINPESMTLL